MTDGQWLTSDDARDALALASALPDNLTGVTALRRQLPHLSPEHASAAMTQAALRRLARERYGIAGDWLLTRDGLEQATRPEIARLRAGWLAEAGVTTVIDATAGLGFDSAAFVAAGMAVTAIERDPLTAALLARNVPQANVVHADAIDAVAGLAREGTDCVVFVDPARRDHRRSADGSRAHPERDPSRWSPPWPWVEGLASHGVRVCAKVAPGFQATAGWQSTWTSVDHVVVDCFVTSWPLHAATARAIAISAGSIAQLDSGDVPPLELAADPGAFLHEPDPAVVRARGLDSLRAIDEGLHRLDASGTWLTSDRASTSTLMRSYRITTRLPADRRTRRRAVADASITSATAKTRDVGIDPRQALRDLGLTEGRGPIVILARHAGSVEAFLAEPVARD